LLEYNKTFISWAERYKNEFNQSPYISAEVNGKTQNCFTPHFIKWVFMKFEDTVQSELNYSIGLAAWLDALDVDIEDYRINPDEKKDKTPIKDIELPKFLQKDSMKT